MLLSGYANVFMKTESKNNLYEMDMCSGPLMRKLISFTIPLVLSSNLQLLFNAVDIVVVGKYSGNHSLAAVGSTTALINLLINLFMGISLGTNVLVGRYYAAHDNRSIHDVVHTSMAFALVSGIITSLVGICSSGLALSLMGTPDNVFHDALLYIRVYFLGMPFFMMYNYGAAVLRAVGDTKRPLFYLIVAGVLNAILNMILVIVFHLGVLGVAVATVISQIVSCVFVLRCLLKTESSYQLHPSEMKIQMSYLKKLFRIGVPAGIQSLVINFSNVLLQSSVNSFGAISMAGYTAADNIFGFLYATVNAFSQTCMSFTSQNYGAGKQKRMGQVLRDCLLLSVGVTIVLGCTVFHFGEHILGIYTPSPEVIQCGMQIFLYTTSTYFICGVMDLLPGAMRGVGYSTVPMILSVIGTVGVRVFWIYCIFPTHHSLDVLFISYPLSWTITVLLQIICFLFVRKRVLRSMA